MLRQRLEGSRYFRCLRKADVERTDFNDLQRDEGLMVVRRQVELGLEMVRGRGKKVVSEREQATKSPESRDDLER